ncbi:MAG: RidA family protein [Actinomycetia bacterium]|nr:RidA family protein [Actinomycetes bacterium]MCP3910731.1 RidA family protein [Actinomycetes bacterium]MCP4084461.1 RidA family protein [Actinomycetes bacterium]
MSIERIGSGPLMSQAVVHGDTIYLSGLVGNDLDADVRGQTAQIVARIDELLAQAGSDKTKVLKANIWLTDIGTWSEMNEVWSDWVVDGSAPARATVEAKLANPKIKVEIMVEAAR